MKIIDKRDQIVEKVLQVISYTFLIIFGFIIGYNMNIKESVGNPDYSKSEIAKEITKELEKYEISLTDSSKRKIDSIRNEFKGKKYYAKSLSAIVDAGNYKVFYSCTEDDKLLRLEIIKEDSTIVLK